MDVSLARYSTSPHLITRSAPPRMPLSLLNLQASLCSRRIWGLAHTACITRVFLILWSLLGLQVTALLLSLALTTQAARAQSGLGVEDLSAQQIFQITNASMCTQCHGTAGRSAHGSALVPLAGMPLDVMTQKMQAYRQAPPASSVMARMARGLTPEQTRSIADYFASQTLTP